jgi:hypothetical protein
MIKELEFRDIPALMPYIRLQREIFGISEMEAANLDMNHYRALISHWLESNCSFVSLNNNKIDGIALGAMYPNMWVPNRKELFLVAVSADNRITAGKLFKTWQERAMLLPVNRILVDKIKGTNFDYEKLGYKLLRQTYELEK